jgi:hypothetical protein
VRAPGSIWPALSRLRREDPSTEGVRGRSVANGGERRPGVGGGNGRLAPDQRLFLAESAVSLGRRASGWHDTGLARASPGRRPARTSGPHEHERLLGLPGDASASLHAFRLAAL